jgi:uncharacterized protein DUF6572
MSLEDTGRIDEIVPPNDERRIGLVIVDSGNVTDARLRLRLLKEKFQHYVEAAMEGAVDPRYRYADPNDFYIDVVCARPPTRQMLKITQVSPENDTKHFLRVNYRESQKGIWTAADSAESAVPVENLASNSLDAIITATFDAGHNCLRNGDAPILLLFLKDAQAYLLPMKDLESDEEITSAVANWTAQNASTVSACVLLRFAACKIDARQTNALVAHVFQAGAKEGLILAQQLYEDNGFFHGSGTLLFLGCCDNLLIRNS